MHRFLFEHIVTAQVLLFKLRNYINIGFKTKTFSMTFDKTYQLYEIIKTGTQMPQLSSIVTEKTKGHSPAKSE